MKRRTGRIAPTPHRLVACAGRLLPIAACITSGFAQPVFAQQPQGAHVVSGTAAINHQGAYTGITTSNGAIINWQSFSIGSGQTVQFIQPTANSRVLNRVTGPDPSRISGTLLSNGMVYITNSAGVFFAHGSLVNVGGIYAAAGTISNADFLGRADRFTGLTGTVENRGTINASQSVNLMGARVANYGTVNVPNGVVTMTAGDEVFIGHENGHFFARVSGPATTPGGTGVTQAGQINAEGGTVNLGAADIYAVAIEHSGTTVAHDITLEGGAHGTVAVSGTLDASSHEADQRGGTVEVLGGRVGLFGGHIDASGNAGGGTVLFGGDFQGQGTTPRSDAAYVSSDATIRADAGRSGDGGKVIVWSDRFTNFQGHISARGGRESGNGGSVETSGKFKLFMSGSVDAAAPRGHAGTWLLDPTDVTLSTAATSGGAGAGDPFTFDPGIGSDTANVNLTEITTALAAGTSVVINTTVAGSTGLGNGDITLVDPLSVTLIGGDATLTLNAVRDININNTITGTGAVGNALGLTFNAGRNVSISSTISLNGGAFAINAAGTVAVTAGVTTGGGNFFVTNSGNTQLGADIDAGSGDLRFDSAVVLTTATVTLSGNDLVFNGKVDSDSALTPRILVLNSSVGGVTQLNDDVGVIAALSSITTNADGTTQLKGEVTTTGDQTYNDAVSLTGNVTAASTGSGAIAFNGTVDADLVANNRTLTVITGGLTTFGQAVGGQAGGALASLTTDATGTTNLGASITTTGDQTYNDAVSLTGNITAASTGGGAIVFNGTVDADAVANNRTLTVNTGGLTSFGQAVGGQAGRALASLTTDATGTTNLGASITTTGDQTYNDAVSLTSNVVAASTGSGAIVFNGTVDADAVANNRTLTVNTGGLTTFGQAVGGQAGRALASLTTDATGTTNLGASITTTGDQTYNDAVSLTGNVVAASTGSGAIAFNGTVDADAVANNRTLDVNTGGLTTFGQAVGGQAGRALGSLTTNATGTTNLAASVTTSGAQTYNDAVSLLANITAASTGSGAIAFNGTVDADAVANNRTLTVNTGGTTTFGQAVGGQAGRALASLTTDATGTTTLASTITTTGDQTYNDAVSLTGNVTAASTGNGAIAFNGTVDADAVANNRTLTVNTGGLTTFGQAVGGQAGRALASLTTDATGTTNLASTITTTGDQTYNDAVSLTGNVSTASTASGAIAFNGTVDADAVANNRTLTVNTGGLTTFAQAVGGQAGRALGSLTTNATGTTNLAASVTTSGAQTYNDAVSLLANITAASTGSGAIAFNGTVDADAVANNRTLTVNTGGTTTFGQAVGGQAGRALASLTTNATGTTNLASTITTTGDQTYNDAVSLTGNVTAASTGGGAIAFNGTVDADAVANNRTLTVNTGGLTTFGQAVGGQAGRALASLTTNATGTTNLASTITTTGDQTYNDAVSLTGNVTASSTGGGAIAFNGTVDADAVANNRTLTLNTGGLTTFGQAVGGQAGRALASLTTDATGTTNLASTITTTGDQTYNDATSLIGNVTATSTGGGAIAFNGTVDADAVANNRTLTVNTGGLTTFGQAVGGQAGRALASVTTNATGTTNLGASITTTGDQTYNDAVSLTGNVVAASTGSGAIAFNGTVDADAVANNRTLDVNTGGLTTFGQAVGGQAGRALGSLTTNATGTTNLAASVTTSGAQTYNDAVSLLANITAASTGSGAIAFNGTVDADAVANNRTLTVNTGGTTTFGQAVGGQAGRALASLTTDATGTTTLASTITTTGDQTYNDAVSLTGNVTAASTGNGAIAFNGTVDADAVANNRTLTVNTGGLTTFGQAVGGQAGRALASLTTDATGTTNLASTITTTGDQTYNDAVSLTGNVSTASTASGAIAFNGTVDADAVANNRTLTVNTGGLTTFAQAVGGQAGRALGSLTTNATGTTNLAASVTTSGAQTYNDAVSLLANITAASTGSGAIAFNGTVDADAVANNRTLTVNTGGTTTFGQAVGGQAGRALASLTTNATGTTNLASTITTTGDQTYNDAVSLTGNVTAASTGGGAIAFNGTVDADAAANNRTLTVNTGGLTTFGQAVGGQAGRALGSLTTNATGTTNLAASVTTSGDQTYNDAVSLTGNVTTASTANGAVTFNSTVDADAAANGRTLTVNTGGVTTFAQAVGGQAGRELGSLTTNATGTTNVAGAVTTTGAQTYNDAVTVNGQLTTTNAATGDVTFGGASTLNADVASARDFVAQGAMTLGGSATRTIAARNINFQGAAATINGARDLALNSSASGTTTLGGAVGGSTALTLLTTNADGTTVLGASVTTTGAQNYNDQVKVNGSIVATSTSSGSIHFFNTVDAGVGAPTAALDVRTAGSTIFDQTVGGALALQSLTTDLAGTTVLATDVTTSGSQNYNDQVLLTGNVKAKSTGGGAISFSNTTRSVDSNIAGSNRTLEIDTAGVTTLAGPAGSLNALGSLTTDAAGAPSGGTTVLGAVTTTGAQTYNDAVTVGGLLTASDGTTGTITFASASNLNADISAGHDFISQGAMTLGGAGGRSITAGNITFQGSGATIDGARALTLASPGTTTLGGLVGNSTALSSLTTSGGGTTTVSAGVTTSGAQLYGDAVTIDGQLTTTDASTGDVTFALTSALNADVSAAHDVLAQGAMTLGGAGGRTIAAGNNITTAAIDGALALTLNSSGTTTLGGLVGGNTALTSLSTNTGGTTIVTSGVTTTGAQTYNDAVTVNGQLAATDSSTGDITFAGTSNLNADVSAGRDFQAQGAMTLGGAGGRTIAAGNNITAATINGARALALNAPGTTTLGGQVGGSTALTSLTTSTGGSTVISAGVTTSGAQSYGDAATVNGQLTTTDSTTGDITLAGPTSLNANISAAHDFLAQGAVTLGGAGARTVAGRNITFQNAATIDGSMDLALNSSGGGTTTLGGAVGGSIALNSLTTNADGTTIITAGVTTSAAQAYNDAATINGELTTTDTTTGDITLAGASNLNADISAAHDFLAQNAMTLGGAANKAISARNITFQGAAATINGNSNLTLNSSNGGTTTLGGAVGGTTALLSLITNSDGITRVGAGVTTTGSQLYSDAITLIGNTVLTSTLNGAIIVNSTINADAGANNRTLAVNTGGVTRFEGVVGGTAALQSLSTDGGGSTSMVGVTTKGSQSYGDIVTVDGTLSAGGDVTFAGPSRLNADIFSGGTFLSQNAMTLGVGDRTITAANINFQGSAATVDGALALTLNSSGTTTLGGAVGGTTALNSFTTDAGGTTVLGASITTGGGGRVDFKDDVVMATGSTVAVHGDGGVRFWGTLDGDGNLAVTTNDDLLITSLIQFDDNVGATTRLRSLAMGADRTDVPNRPTIVTGNSDLQILTTGDITMGVGQKFAAAGNLTLGANGGAATLSDISAGGNLNVQASAIRINLRAAGNVLQPDGTSVADAGVDFVANSINFSVTPTTTPGTSGANPTFATPGASNISGTLTGFIQRSFSAPPGGLTSLIHPDSQNFFDLRSEGATTANVATVIAGATPRENQAGKVEQGTPIGKSKLRDLLNMGIRSKDPNDRQLQEFLCGRAMYNDVPTGKTELVASDYEVTVNRLPPDTIDRVLNDYKAVYTRTAVDASTGETTEVTDTDYVNQRLGDAWNEYSPDGTKPPEGFRAFLQADASRAEALRYLDGLRTLLTDLRLLGLSAAELESVRDTVVGSIKIGADASEARKAIMGPAAP